MTAFSSKLHTTRCFLNMLAKNKRENKDAGVCFPAKDCRDVSVFAEFLSNLPKCTQNFDFHLHKAMKGILRRKQVLTLLLQFMSSEVQP